MRFVAAEWVRARIGTPRLTVVDPRRRMRYLQGHLEGAISVPVVEALVEGHLRDDADLAAWLGASGIGTDATVVVYDGYDGQFGAMLAWLLKYLGHPDVCLLDFPIDEWKPAGGELFYRPVPAVPAEFALRPRPELRASWKDAGADSAAQLIDTRSEEEYRDDAGHLPGARHLAWTAFVQPHQTLFRPDDELMVTLKAAGIDPARPTIAYCRAGTRAAVATIALARLGCPVRLYDGSFLDWTSRDLPVEVEA